MATEKNLKKLTIHKLKKKTYNALAEKPVDELVMLTDVGGQVAEITEASADYVGEIVQYVGETNDTYTNGFFYKCVETDGVYSWTQVNVQEGGGGASGDCLPLSGGTLTGPLEISLTAQYNSYTLYFLRLKNVGPSIENTLAIGYDGKEIIISYAGISQAGTITPGAAGTYDLGGKYSTWRTVYAGAINAGSLDGVVGGDLIVPTEGGTLARIEDINNIVEVLPTADNGYTTVKNFGNNYIEATGVYEVGLVEANAEVVDVIAFPEGIQFEEGQMYWANAHATTEDSNGNTVVANVISRGSSDITIVYKNLGSTEVENLTICWEVRGVVAPK